jgi:hypothetical protein
MVQRYGRVQQYGSVRSLSGQLVSLSTARFTLCQLVSLSASLFHSLQLLVSISVSFFRSLQLVSLYVSCFTLYNSFHCMSAVSLSAARFIVCQQLFHSLQLVSLYVSSCFTLCSSFHYPHLNEVLHEHEETTSRPFCDRVCRLTSQLVEQGDGAVDEEPTLRGK